MPRFFVPSVSKKSVHKAAGCGMTNASRGTGRMSAKKPLSLITFDVDDTLYATSDFVRLARENSVKAMIATGLKADLAQAMAELNEVVMEFSSNDERHFDRLLVRLPKESLDGINPAIIVAAGVAAYHDTVHNNLAAYEDVGECVKSLYEKGFRMGSVSQGTTVKQAEKLVRLRILPYLDKRAIFLSDQMGMSKSNPKYYQRAAEILNLPPKQCMHVGDRPDRDIDPANESGWITVLNRRSGRYHERPGATPPAYTIHNFWDLAELIEKEFEPA
jgi:putative hydrolase of the HAD superfamily